MPRTGFDATPTASRRAGGRAMLNFALVGCGSMANWHAQQLKLIAEGQLVALVDILPSHAHIFKEKYSPDALEYTSLPALPERPPARLDAVVLVTPHMRHYPEAKAALERGVNVLVEKPMVT